MVFSSIPFIFYFLPLVIAGHYVIRSGQWRVYWLCAASLLFYTWAVGWFVGIMLLVAAVSWLSGRKANNIALSSGEKDHKKYIPVAISVTVSLGVLGYFKYTNFALEQFNFLSGYFGLSPVFYTSIILPAGISFFTFHAISYVIDVGRGECRPFSNPIQYLFYLVFFPHLIAGPIVRFHEIADQIRSRAPTFANFSTGASLFMWGLVKKVVVADSVALLVNAVFSADSSRLSAFDVTLGALAYTVQIYFDFSGYSTMAIGLAMMFGFYFPQNFDRPYSARSITEFWRRWHITLSNWFRDYLYVPLGGNRLGSLLTYRNLIIVFLATGIWHGANWTFIIWGLWHGFWIVVERLMGRRALGETESYVGRASTLILVMIGWIMFRSADIGQAFDMYAALLDWSSFSLSQETTDTLTPWCLLMLVVGCSTFFLPRTFNAHRFIFEAGPRVSIARTGLAIMTAVVTYPLALLAVVSSTFSAFLYFQF